MDKFVTEQLEHIKELADELQACFIDDDAYSRTPSALEWRRAGRTVRQITLACHELFGYAKARRAVELNFARERIRFVPDENEKNPDVFTPGLKKPTLEEINAMLVELNIKLKARQRPDGLFEIRPTVGGRRVSVYGHTADELSKKLEKVLKAKTAAQPKSKITLYEWLDEWLEVYKKPNVAANTYSNLEKCVRKQIKGGLLDKPLNRYTMTELTKMLNGIESTRMRKYARGTLRDALNCAVTVGHIKESPAQNLLPVKHVSKKGEAIPLLDLNEMIKHAVGKIPREVLLYFLFTLFAGTRRDEGLDLRVDDCDFKNCIIHIRGTKTEGSNRRLPMFPILEKILRAAGGENGQTVFRCGKYHANTDFPRFRGEMTNAKLHWLRHTFGTIQICVFGIPANTVALWLGHSDASTTMQIYTHPENLAPDIYYSGLYSEPEKIQILQERYNEIISTVENLL